MYVGSRLHAARVPLLAAAVTPPLGRYAAAPLVTASPRPLLVRPKYKGRPSSVILGSVHKIVSRVGT